MFIFRFLIWFFLYGGKFFAFIRFVFGGFRRERILRLGVDFLCRLGEFVKYRFFRILKGGFFGLRVRFGYWRRELVLELE